MYEYASQVQHQDIRYTCGILMHVASGLSSWSMAGSWHVQVASLRLQSIMGTSVRFTSCLYFSFLSKRSGRRMPPAERSALHNIMDLHDRQTFSSKPR